MKLAFVLFGSALGASMKPLASGQIGNMLVMKVEHEQDGVKTPFGSINIGLFNEELPLTSENFEWACENHFANSVFHRVIPGFMAQGGDFTNGNGTGGKSKWGENFADEKFIYKHDGVGALSMANRGPNTNGSQFFLTFQPTSWLDGKHVVFGCVTDNREILTALEANGSRSGATKGTLRITSCSVSGAPEGTTCLAAKGKPVADDL